MAAAAVRRSPAAAAASSTTAAGRSTGRAGPEGVRFAGSPPARPYLHRHRPPSSRQLTPQRDVPMPATTDYGLGSHPRHLFITPPRSTGGDTPEEAQEARISSGSADDDAHVIRDGSGNVPAAITPPAGGLREKVSPPPGSSPASSGGSDRPRATDGQGAGQDLLTADTTPEAQLLSKFKHVYAGRGGWLGVPAPGDGGDTGPVRTRGRSASRRDATGTKDAGQVRRHRTMPKAQYERYKKEIMHKLARTLQNQEEEYEPEVEDSAKELGAAGMASRAHAPHVLRETDINGMLAPHSSAPNVTIPASWRLPVGWAGRNKGLAGASRHRPRRHRGPVEERPPASSTVTGRSPPGGALQRVSGASGSRDRSHFTRSWVQNSAFSGNKPWEHEAKGGASSGEEGARVPPYTIRIGPLLHGLPPDHDADSIPAPPSRIQTEGVHPHPGGGVDTSRTGLTTQSFPVQDAARLAGDGSGKQQFRKRKNPRALGQSGGRMPTSSRANMNMFSRMSLEAQAALKEMGMVTRESSTEDSDCTSDEETSDTQQPGVNNNIGTGLLKASNHMGPSRPSATSTSVSNVVSKSGERLNKSTVVVQQKKPSQSDTQDTSDTTKLVGERQKLTQDIVKPPATPRKVISNSSEEESRSKEVVVFKNEGEAVQGRGKVGVESTTERGNKQCSCKVRAGIVLKNGTLSKQPSITLRVTSPQHVTNGYDVSPPDADYVRVSVSHVSRTRTRLPNIRESPTGSVPVGDNTENTESTTPFLGTHRQIPGVGQYKRSSKPLVIRNWARENTFEITPVGYDSRFEDIATRGEDIDETPEEIKEKAILKCTDWLKKYH